MSQIPSDHVYTEFQPKTKITWKPNLEPSVTGDYQDAGVVPGFWTGTWRSQVASNIDNGFFGGVVASVTSPVQYYQAYNAKDTIFNGVIDIADRTATKVKYSEALNAIQYDEQKTGKEWWEALPEQIKQDADDMGITPTNFDYAADIFANDFKETYAWSVYVRDASRTAEKHSGFANFAGNLLLGAATDPTSLISFGIGKAGTLGKLVASAGKTAKLGTFGGNLAFQTALGGIQQFDSMIHRDYQSERLGVAPGDITGSDYITNTLYGAGINALTATGLHGLGYASRMALNGASRKLTGDALAFAKGTQNLLHSDVMTPGEFATLFNKINDGRALKPSEQVPILREVLSQYGLNLHDDSFYDFGSFEAVGMHPIDVAAKILHEGLSPHQVTTLFNNAAMVADDIVKVSPGPLPRTKLQEAVAYVPTEPVVNVTKQLPKYVTDAGYQFDAVGNLVKGAAPVATSAATPPSTGTGATLAGFGKGMAESFYTSMYDRLAAGKLPEPFPTNKQSAFARQAKAAFDRGEIKSAADLKALPHGHNPIATTPVVAGTPTVEAPKVAEAPPARQGLDAEVIDPMTPPKAKAGQSEDPIASALMKSKDAQDFAVKLGDMLAEGKLVMTKEIKDRIKTIIGSYEMAKDLALKTSAEVTGPKVTEADLKARATKVTGRSDTLVPQDKAGNRQIEFPNLRDRLIWMSGKGFTEVQGEAKKILNDFYGLGIREIRNLRTAIKESIAAAGKPGHGVDRLKVTRNPDGSFKTEILRSLGGPKERSIGDAVKALTPESAAKADAYAKKHNLNVQDKINKVRAKIVSKGDNVPEPEFNGSKGLKPKDAKEYAMAVKQGKYAQAYQILNDSNMGDNNAAKIAELYVRSKNARLALETAVRTGVDKDINAAKADLDKIHAEFNKQKIALFASSDTKLGRVELGVKMLGGQSRILKTLAGTPIEPSHSFYVEPVGPQTGRDSIMSDVLLRLNRAIAKMDPRNLASRVSTDVPDGMFSNVANAILKLDGTFFLKSEAGRALTDKTPLVSLLVDLIDTNRLEASNIIGKNQMGPSFGTISRKMNTELRAVVKNIVDGAKKLGVAHDSEALDNAVFEAMLERVTGTKKSSGVNRTLVDLVVKEMGGYFDRGGIEGVLAGKIRQYDPKYFRVILNRAARHDLPGVSNAFYESHVAYFLGDDSPIHEGTLQKVHPIEVLKADGSPIETLKDLKDANPQAANDYMKMLANDDRSAPLRNMSDRAIRVRMGIEVADDADINREVSYYMNSGLGKHLDSALLVNANMRKYIETNPFNVLNEYSRNVRYYALRQDAVNKFIQNLTGTDIKGVTWNDLLAYSERRLQDIYGDSHHDDIKALFDALNKKEAQVTGRLMGKNAGNAGIDGLMTIAVAPVQATVAGGITFTSGTMEAAKAFVGNMYRGILGPEGGTGMISSFSKLIRGMHKRDILAGQHAMLGALEHVSLYDVDHSRMSYAGGTLATKLNLVRKAFADLGTSVKGFGDSSVPMGSRFKNFAQGVSAAFNEPIKQLFMIDNITAVTADAYHARARWEFSAYIEQVLKDPSFFSKDRSPTEILSRMEAVGLFSDDAVAGLKAINKASPDFFSKDWTMTELNELMLRMRGDSKIDGDSFNAAQNTYNALWKACDDYVDSRVMTLPRVWDMADTGQPHALNRFLNTFTGYSRWFFSRHMLQRFPTSSSYKVAMLGAWYVMAEAVSMLMRDALQDWDKFNQMTDDVDDDLAETYLSQALMRVPTMGQLTNSAFGGARQAWNLMAPKEYQTSTESYRGGTLYSGYVWKAGFDEVSKAARGETYDMNKVRKLIPFMNAPVVGGFFQEDK